MLQFGEHSQKKNMAVVRRVNAKTFAQAGTAAEALKLMEANKVPLEERPPAWQIKNFRPSKGRVQEREVADCIHSLQEFLRSPPENIFVWEQPICGADKIQIGFSSKLAMERLSSCNLDSFAGRYQAYCDNLLKDGVWGDDLTLLAGAHILRRPIVIITDSASDNYAREICPPHIIDRSLWGQNIFVTCNLDRHFDATETVLGGDPAARSHRVEQFTAL